MVTERESMTLNEVGARALGVEERSDETPRARASGARPAPDPEVVAKPKRRQFTAEYRLRILEEADRCMQPGEVGRLLRREGLYTSHLAAWRKARRQGSLRGLTPSKRGARPAERHPLSAKVRELDESGSAGEGVAHRAHDPGSTGKSCRAAGIQPQRREGLLMAAQGLASQVGVAPACRALGVSRATFYRRHKATPGHQQPRPTPARALCESEREHVLNVPPPLASSTARPPRSSPRCSMKANTCARSARCIGSWPRISRCESGELEHPRYTKPELVATGANETWSWDITRLLGPTRWSYFYLYVLLDIFSR